MFYRITFVALLLVAILGSCTEEPQTQPARSEPLPDSVTFAEHIGPIVWANCMPCHRPGSAGPFSLISYRDVAKRAKMVAQVTADRYMPPWPADPAYRHFLGERVLSQRDIDLLGKWAAQRAPAGDLAAMPEPPHYPDGSMLGKPDLVVTMKEAYPIRGNNTDRFLFMKLPFEIPQDTFIRAIEFVPGNRKAVHHMNGHLISFDPAKKKDVFAGEWVVDREVVPVNEAYPRMGLLQDDGSYPSLTPLVSNYLPGVTPGTYPEGIGGYFMPQKGAFLLNDLHYGPQGVDTFDQSTFNVFFAPKAPKRPTMELQMGTLGISDIVPPLIIPPDTVMTFRTRAVIRQDVSLLTINPHMHLLGKSFLAYAITPASDTIPLIRIPEWDFRWQYFYTFDHLLHLPAGSVVQVEAVYDNTRDNPNNPFDPPQTVSERDGSMRTTDEMLQCILTFVPYQPGDENVELGE
ncbi:MAG: cytochrome c [Bacteroidia bacterium]|nr:cytochrome c [Bacteroidia bacterium]